MKQNRGVISRRSYAKLRDVIEMPDLLAIQVASYQAFLQTDISPEQRKKQGLQAVFQAIFPITDVHNQYVLEFVEYSIGKPKYNVRECQDRDTTYAAPLRATLRLISKDRHDKDRIKDIVEQTVFLGELPLMTEKGTFIINGSERVIVSQLHRSPGIFFDETTHPNGKRLLSARIIPYRGAWVEFTMDINDAMYVHIDKKRKLPVTTLLRAFDLSTDGELLSLFRGIAEVRDVSDELVGMVIFQDVENETDGGRPIVMKWMKKLTVEDIDKLREMEIAQVNVLTFTIRRVDDELVGCVLYDDVIDPSSGEVFAQWEVVTPEMVSLFKRMGIDQIKSVAIQPKTDPDVIGNSIDKDPTKNSEQALARIYSLLRPGDPPNIETARNLLERLFFHPKRYYLGEVGRYRINQRLDLDIPLSSTVLHKQDFVAIISYLLTLRRGEGYTDDIDHLGNRRVRSVGELLSNQFSVGLSRMARTIRERMSLRDSDSLTPHELVNARTVSTVINSFFGSSQLSQFMQQINPLDELTHKRRLSALGPGGLARDRAGFEVRDVHHTHYGRICPIETPEGPNIGLIASLSTYARVNPYGFLETPYRVVRDGRVVDEMTLDDPEIVGMTAAVDVREFVTGTLLVKAGELLTKPVVAVLVEQGIERVPIVRYLSADQEDKYTIAPASARLDEDGQFVDLFITARLRGDFPVVAPHEINYMDVSSKQLVSAAAALIPFLEHDDANRALMGSNMQRQAVPLLRTEAPLIGTGLECEVAFDSGVMVVARNAGVVTYVSADRIVVKRDEETSLDLLDEDVHELTKFKLSNQQTCINQRPIVRVGDRVTVGDVLADGQSTDNGDLALGANVLVAFMPWNGCNFEDAIVVSERLLHDDVFTSIHIEEFQLQVRDTKRGSEEITREIPNVGEQAIRNLDEQGIIRIGAEVKPGDILVGKITPKGETELSPEERLLRAIFGEKAGDVRDASLRAPSGMDGVVMDRKVFSRKERDEKTKRMDREHRVFLETEAGQRIKKVKEVRDRRIAELLMGKKVGVLRNIENNSVIFNEGRFLDEDVVRAIDLDNVRADGGGWTDDEQINEKVCRLIRLADEQIGAITEELEQEIDKLTRGDELPPGIVQLVNVYIARKRKLSVGDKIAGRHGNKGVVAKIVPVEDMPHLPDGTPVDIVLNPLGVPSRMNLGQIFETHLGWAAHKLGIHVETPVFSGATLDEIKQALRVVGLPESGKTILYDGKTGESFDQEVAVGYIYIMKLLHLVSDKIHARSIGPYSLVTQQPLGGKAQFGGQRFGEMEVWALEAYGAAYLLQEMLTVKSDDVTGRSRIYEAIVKGENPPEPGIPESFNVLVKELQSLCLDVRLEDGTH